jgi:polar amino acid transport system substrate-binding protein
MLLSLALTSLVCAYAHSNIRSESSNTELLSTPIKLNVGLIVFPPLIQQAANDKCFGEAIDTIADIFPYPEYALNIYCSTPSRIYRDFSQNKIDITFNIKSSTSLGNNIYYSTIPYSEVELILYSRSSTNYHQGDKKTISAIRGYGYNGTRNQLELEGYVFYDHSNTRAATTFFLRGASTSLISYKEPFEYYVNKLKKRRSFRDLSVAFTELSISKVKTYFVVNGKHKHAKKLLDKINNQAFR